MKVAQLWNQKSYTHCNACTEQIIIDSVYFLILPISSLRLRPLHALLSLPPSLSRSA